LSHFRHGAFATPGKKQDQGQDCGTPARLNSIAKGAMDAKGELRG
jgi:hypothetical protein